LQPDIQRPWLANYPPGVPATIDESRYRSVVELLEESFAKHASREVAVCLGRALSYRALDELSASLGAWLQARGLGPGKRVAIMMPNLLQYPVALAAVLRAGCTVVNVNPLYTPRELEHQLRDSSAQAIIVLENFAATLAEVMDRTAVQHVVLASTGDLLGFWKGQAVNFALRHLRKVVPEFELPMDRGRSVTRFNMAVAEGTRLSLRRVAIGPDDIAFLQYTGGTTGLSKGAMLLHRNVVANILQSEAWFRPLLSRVDERRQLTTVCALPLYHIYALTACFLLGARVGMRSLLIPNPRDIPAFVNALRDTKVHMFPGVNTLFNALASDADFARLDFSELMISNGGGMAVQQSTAQHWRSVTGCAIIEGYGLSETAPVATINRFDAVDFNGCIGLPVPSTDVVIRDDAGNDLPLGGAGEICIRGPQVMAGYWNRPDETANVMTADGFFRSGDIGVMDTDGLFRIVDRKKDMILVSGFNVYPTEIEQVVGLHAGVLECAAIGVPDERSGEAVKLFVVRRDASLSESDMAQYCRENFTAYKRPRHIEFRDELPKSNVGKILRRELRA
jgi:long-chain acyl-CoA synthetase